MLVDGQVVIDVQATAHALGEKVATVMILIVIMSIILSFFNTRSSDSIVMNDNRYIICNEWWGIRCIVFSLEGIV